MNAGKFVSDTSHHHNTSLHSYLHRLSPSSSSNNISSSSQQQGTGNTTPTKHTVASHDTVSVEDNDEQALNSTPGQIKEVMESTIKNSSYNKSIRKADTSGSKKNLKRKSVDIQSYFTSSGVVITMYVAFLMIIISKAYVCIYVYMYVPLNTFLNDCSIISTYVYTYVYL